MKGPQFHTYWTSVSASGNQIDSPRIQYAYRVPVIPGETGGVGSGPKRMKQPRVFGELDITWHFWRQTEGEARLRGTCIPKRLLRCHPVLDGGSLKDLERDDRIRYVFYKGASVASVENKMGWGWRSSQVGDGETKQSTTTVQMRNHQGLNQVSTRGDREKKTNSKDLLQPVFAIHKKIIPTNSQ